MRTRRYQNIYTSNKKAYELTLVVKTIAIIAIESDSLGENAPGFVVYIPCS